MAATEQEGTALDKEDQKPVGSTQVHLRVSAADGVVFRRLARDRDQSISATFRFLLRYYLRCRQNNPPSTAPQIDALGTTGGRSQNLVTGRQA